MMKSSDCSMVFPVPSTSIAHKVSNPNQELSISHSSASQALSAQTSSLLQGGMNPTIPLSSQETKKNTNKRLIRRIFNPFVFQKMLFLLEFLLHRHQVTSNKRFFPPCHSSPAYGWSYLAFHTAAL